MSDTIYIIFIDQFGEGDISDIIKQYTTCFVRLLLTYGVDPTSIYIFSPEPDMKAIYDISQSVCSGANNDIDAIIVPPKKGIERFRDLLTREANILMFYLGHGDHLGNLICDNIDIDFVKLLVNRFADPKYDNYEHCLLINACYSNKFAEKIIRFTNARRFKEYTKERLEKLDNKGLEDVVKQSFEVSNLSKKDQKEMLTQDNNIMINYLLKNAEWLRRQSVVYKQDSKMRNVSILTGVSSICDSTTCIAVIIMIDLLRKTMDNYYMKRKNVSIVHAFAHIKRMVQVYMLENPGGKYRNHHTCCGEYVSPYNMQRLSTFFPAFRNLATKDVIVINQSKLADPSYLKELATLKNLQRRQLIRKQLIKERRNSSKTGWNDLLAQLGM